MNAPTNEGMGLGPCATDFFSRNGLVIPPSGTEQDSLLIDTLGDIRTQHQDELFDLCEELLLADRPKTVRHLIEVHELDWDFSSNFRVLLFKGSVAMLEAELDAARAFFESAYALEPEEIAPIVNLVTVCFQIGDLPATLKWVNLGLDISLNDARLWSYCLAVLQATAEEEKTDPAEAGRNLLKIAQNRNAWVGCLIAVEGYASEEDGVSEKCKVLDTFYSEGNCDNEFLIEYTGILGSDMQYERVNEVLLQAKLNPKRESKPLPWQALVHGAQASYGLERFQEALGYVSQAEKVCEFEEQTVALKSIKEQINQEYKESENKETPQ